MGRIKLIKGFTDNPDEISNYGPGGKISIDKNGSGSAVYDESYTINGIKTSNQKGLNQITDMRGVIDYGNLLQFAPYESGYSFIAVINGPSMAKKIGGDSKTQAAFQNLQTSFINIIEKEFRGLDGIEDITSDTMEFTDNITSMSLISKVNQPTNSQITMRFFEKSGVTITKYIANYLRYIRDPKTQAKTYGGGIKANMKAGKGGYGPAHEVFNMLYIVTDATCLHVEKAFLLLNAQPINAAFSELYNFDKGAIENKEITVTWNCFVVDGKRVNYAAATYLTAMIDNIDCIDGFDESDKTSKNDGINGPGKIHVNSWDYNWSISTGTDYVDGNGKKHPNPRVGDMYLEDGSITFSRVNDGDNDPTTGSNLHPYK